MFDHCLSVEHVMPLTTCNLWVWPLTKVTYVGFAPVHVLPGRVATSECTLQAMTTHAAGKDYSLSIITRDSAGVAITEDPEASSCDSSKSFQRTLLKAGAL